MIFLYSRNSTLNFLVSVWMQQSLYSRLNFFSIIYTNTIKLNLGFFQQHLWVLLHIEHDKPDKNNAEAAYGMSAAWPR